MDLNLTGRMMGSEEAERSGLVTAVFESEELVDKTVEMAQKIASFSLPVACMVKESVNASFEMPLAQGLSFERRLFHSLFSTVFMRFYDFQKDKFYHNYVLSLSLSSLFIHVCFRRIRRRV